MTDLLTIWIIAVGLAMDCFTVSLCIGSSPVPQTFRSIFRVSFHFGLFQGGMALLGWLLGTTVVNRIAGVDHWIALALLGWIGIHMIKEGLSQPQDSAAQDCEDRTRGKTLVMLSIATSIDALGVGLTLGLLKIDVYSASLIIGLVSLVLSVVGLLSGKRLNNRFGKRVEVLGGLILVFIGLRIVVTHLLA